MDHHVEQETPMITRGSDDMQKPMPIGIGPTTANMLSHTLSPEDADNPMNWPLHRRLYVSSVAWAFAFVAAFGLTSYTAAIPEIVTTFDVSMTTAISAFSLYLFGIFFAPIYTPHLAERFGRSILYLISIFCCALFHLGAGLSQNFTSLAICRFFAGLFAGPSLVLIEGTFADTWSAETTNVYYSFLGIASYFGAAAGPIVGNFVVQAGSWRWSEYVPLMLILAALLYGINMPETYGREIPRRRNRQRKLPPPQQPPAESGVTLGQIVMVTVVNPLKQIAMEPIVTMICYSLAVNWAVTFQWFITVPVVLTSVYNFTPQRAGLAFISAIGGATLAALGVIITELTIYTAGGRRSMAIEKRLIPAMYGSLLIIASLFWIGWTADPSISYYSPIFGTAVFIWGGLSVLISLVTYLFDAYPPAGTLAALTAAACTRILFAGIIPLVIVQMFTKLTGKWALGVWGFLSIPSLFVPFILYFLGPKLRARSPYSRSMSIHSHMPLPTEMTHMERGGMENVHV